MLPKVTETTLINDKFNKIEFENQSPITIIPYI